MNDPIKYGEAADRLLDAATKLTESLLESLDKGLNGDGEHPAVIQDMCRTLTSAMAVAHQLRAREKMAIKERNSLKPQQVLDWLKAQPEQVRLHMLREISEAIEGQGSVLA
jgi:hypothetical protein